MEARHARMQECENARKWFVLSIRNTADTLKSQPDTRAGKPNKQQL